ncbi:MarR family transcriptional regulator [Cryobacterium sp. SO2]|uniref:MarR family winged helix-turn-helix transcriptional regulator n=1 Tax=Cryobacterium sp. SO2 TaxID=1897060 RepID=UPI00223DD6F0|nr:MarR family transcriptional regulator [Cryobacterium sp. SO2]WEO77397.1 MarR family transcriptional regulator [Cryobacterium sp. SO2]
MDVKPELFGTEYNASRAIARRGGGPMAERDVRARIQRLGLKEQAFRRHLADQIAVDEMGLEVMDNLMSRGSSSPTELAHEINISTAAMSLVLQRLESAGHITRQRHPSDGRRLVVAATDDSVRLAYGHVLPLVNGLEAVVASMSEAERAAASDFLDKVIAAYDGAMN